MLTLVVITGMHRAALQTVAWTTMLAANLEHHSLADSLCRTFDGKHPCCLCEAIATAKKSQKKNPALSPTVRFEFPPLPEKFAIISPSPASALSQTDVFAEAFFPRPPVPPPRGLLG